MTYAQGIIWSQWLATFKNGAGHTLILHCKTISLGFTSHVLFCNIPMLQVKIRIYEIKMWFDFIDVKTLPAVFQVTAYPVHQHTLPQTILRAHPNHQ